MKKILLSAIATASLGIPLSLIGCGSNLKEAPTEEIHQGHNDHHDHHDHHDH